MKWAIAIFALAGTYGALAQGTFQNLNFEDANIVPIPGQSYAVTVANALPDWTVDYGGVQQTQIYYNDLALGNAQVTLDAAGYTGYPDFSGPVIDGNFSIGLQSGAFNGTFANTSISQTGQIPIGTQSLFFDVANIGNGVAPEVSIGNDSLTLFPVGAGTGVSITYTTYGANISAWAGQSEPLTFSSPGQNVFLDDISFSPTAITVTPEPNPVVLMGIGGALFAAYRHFAPKR